MSRLLTFLVMIGAGFVAIAGFAAPFYIGLAVLRLRFPGVDAALGAIGAAFVLLVVWITARIGGRIEARFGAAPASIQRGGDRKRVVIDPEKLAADPRWPHFAPLIRRWRTDEERIVLSWERRYRELLADPKRRHHAKRALDGEFPGNRQIDYDDDPAMLLTCSHLKPVERDLRAARRRIWVRGEGPFIATDATLDFNMLRIGYALPDFVLREWEEGDHRGEPGELLLRCNKCRSSIMSGFGDPFPAS